MTSKIALLIGNGTFDDASFRPLARPPTDVEALWRVLSSKNIGGFDEVVRLVNPDSNTARKQIAALFKNRASDDILVLFYAGHGVKDEYGQLHLVMKDTASDELSATGIASDFIAREMDHSRSLSQILILDCCFSGAFADARGGEAGSVGARDSFKGNGTGRIVLTASDAFEYAWEREDGVDGPNSVFTSFLTKGLETGDADMNRDGDITVDEWYDYVYDQMQRSTKRQTPHRSVAGAGSVVIATSPRPPVELEPALMDLIRNAYPRARQEAVRELAYLLQGTDRGIAIAARAHLEKLSHDVDPRVSSAAGDVLVRIASYSDAPTDSEIGVATPQPDASFRPADPDPTHNPTPKPRKASLLFGFGIVILVICVTIAIFSSGSLLHQTSEIARYRAMGVVWVNGTNIYEQRTQTQGLLILSLIGFVIGLVMITKGKRSRTSSPPPPASGRDAGRLP